MSSVVAMETNLTFSFSLSLSYCVSLSSLSVSLSVCFSLGLCLLVSASLSLSLSLSFSVCAFCTSDGLSRRLMPGLDVGCLHMEGLPLETTCRRAKFLHPVNSSSRRTTIGMWRKGNTSIVAQSGSVMHTTVMQWSQNQSSA